ADHVEIDGVVAIGTARDRVRRFLDLIRGQAGIDSAATVTSSSNFPAASGLASSASAFAALAAAGTRAAGLELSPRALSALARRGSGSAARSIYGGFVRMYDGDEHDTAYAEPIASDWGAADGELRMVIAIAAGGPKKHPSRDAMDHCAATSPLYPGWLGTVDHDLRAAEDAIVRRHLPDLGAVMERSALTMHASMWAARPAIRYFKPVTLALMDAIESVRDDGTLAFYTMDAGPHVKVLTTADHADQVQRALAAIDGVREVLISKPGPGIE
ncbi:MAG: diphosphomevalonate decarboxylase, partial [Deltaproteobacteria bacterium]|nr:diphosphomevalonate decarboxylase [Deltaproteobacteria bacterium]